MTQEEKAAQVGRIVLERNEAVAEFRHVSDEIGRIGKLLSELGGALMAQPQTVKPLPDIYIDKVDYREHLACLDREKVLSLLKEGNELSARRQDLDKRYQSITGHKFPE